MKNLINKTATLTLITIFAISLTLQAANQWTNPDGEDKKTKVNKTSIFHAVADALDLSDMDMAILSNEMEEIKALTLTYAEEELHVTFDSQVLVAFGMEEDYRANQLSDWMFDELTESENEMAVEDWMLSDDYYSEAYESSQLEDWMFNELVADEESMEIEDWMMEELSPAEPEMEMAAWMFDPTYLGR